MLVILVFVLVAVLLHRLLLFLLKLLFPLKKELENANREEGRCEG